MKQIGVDLISGMPVWLCRFRYSNVASCLDNFTAGKLSIPGVDIKIYMSTPLAEKGGNNE